MIAPIRRSQLFGPRFLARNGQAPTRGRAPPRGCYPWDLEEIGYLLVTVFLLVNTLLATPSVALAGIIHILIGLPVHEYFRRQFGLVTPPFWQ